MGIVGTSIYSTFCVCSIFIQILWASTQFQFLFFSDTASAKKMDDKQWYQFDDSIVSETREDRLVVSSLNTTSCKLAHRYL